jgi:hypothetical protein
MSAYLPGIPLPGDLLSDSQNDIKNNFTAANTSFGRNHFAFDNGTANNGFHNHMTTPQIDPVGHPVTAAGYCELYAMQDSANLGLLQYSRGPSNAATSPVTYLQSPVAAISLSTASTTPVLDATGLTKLNGILYASSNIAPLGIGVFAVTWTGSVWLASTMTNATSIGVTITGNTINIKNNSGSNFTGLFWTLQIYRVN